MLFATLGQSGSMSSMFVWIVVLIVIAVVGGTVIFNVRRRMLASDDSVSVGSSGLLDHLHQMHKNGEIDDEEFARARSSILKSVQDNIESKKSADDPSITSTRDRSILDEIDLDNP